MFHGGPQEMINRNMDFTCILKAVDDSVDSHRNHSFHLLQFSKVATISATVPAAGAVIN